jgi:hypothetical protein
MYFILFALLYNFSCGEAGSAKKETPKSAEIKFQNERIDIGVIDGKSNANIDFKFSNTGNAPLAIIEARGNCHCVHAKAPEKAIEPGDSSVISVSFSILKEYQPYFKGRLWFDRMQQEIRSSFILLVK